MRKSALFGLFALFAGLAPAFAGEVYVPFATNKSVNGATYRTRVWVTNTSSVLRRAAVRFLNEGTDGTQAATTTAVNVAPGATVVLTDVAPPERNGILEVSGPAPLVVTSRLDVISGGGEPLASVNVPVVAVGNVIAAGKVAEVQGLERTQRGTITDFGILNLNSTTTQCTVKAFRADNTQISQTVVLTLLPLSVRHFDEALAVLGQNFIADVRIETSCDKQFFPYGLVYKPGGNEMAFMSPSETLEGDLVGGGGNPPPGGAVVFQQPGTFLAAKQGASYKAFTLPLVDGVRYSRATLEFDLFVDRFPPGLFAGVTSLRRNDRTLYYGLIIRGDKQKTVLDMGITDDVVTGPNGGPWAERNSFHVVIDYDTPSSTLTFKVFKAGSLVQTLTGRLNHTDLSLSGHLVTVDFGLAGIADSAYFPPIGWVFSNLKVTFTP